jgi:hypothetical protein
LRILCSFAFDSGRRDGFQCPAVSSQPKLNAAPVYFLAPRVFHRGIHTGDFSANETLGVVPSKHIQVAEDRSHFTSGIKPLYRLTIRIDFVLSA